MTPRRKHCLILKWTQLPDPMKKLVRSWHGFHNDCLLSHSIRSEFSAKELRQGIKALEDYRQEQIDINNFQGSLEEFIKKYRLEFDHWIIQQAFNLEDIDEILVDVGW